MGAALEQEKLSSHLHPVGSFDVADHDVPTGREEIWRFTPLKRLRGLHADAEFLPTAIDSTWNTPEGVRVAVVEGGEARGLRGLSGLVPNTRFAARVLAEVGSTLLVSLIFFPQERFRVPVLDPMLILSAAASSRRNAQ